MIITYTSDSPNHSDAISSKGIYKISRTNPGNLDVLIFYKHGITEDISFYKDESESRDKLFDVLIDNWILE